MKFSQKLVCTMLVVIAAFFSAGGCVLVQGSFADRMDAAAAQEQNVHAMLCGVAEDYYLDCTAAGEDTAGEDFFSTVLSRLGESSRGAYTVALFRDDDPDAGDALYGLADGECTLVKRDAPGGMVLRYYRTDLLGGMVLESAYDVTEIFTARAQSMRRFFAMEGAVVLSAAVVVWLVSRRLTRPLTLLTSASGRIAQGEYDLRTNIRTGDEFELSSRAFDRMAEAVQEKVEQLELSVQQRDDFVGAFTHELKTPMTGIIGYADLLRTAQPDPDEQREAAQSIFREAKRLEALSGKLLQLMGLGEQAPALCDVPLAPVFAAAARAAAPVLNGCVLHTQANGLTVRGDADLLCDLVLNLVTNAAKASEPGSPITVEAAQTGETVTLTVADHGHGIPADKLARVTEPFYMVDKSRARRQGGSGLGLALCCRIAQAHGGELHIESTVDAGTTVTVTLPAAPAAPARRLRKAEPKPEQEVQAQ